MPLHPSIQDIPLPIRMRSLPVDQRGFPVPWFVAWVNGQPDHRVVDDRKRVKCVQEKRCWLCGDKLKGERFTFVIGPMCAVNRVSAEPPEHLNCALYAVQACPFMARPHMIRREAGLPEEAQQPAGVMLRRNPGVALVWTTTRYKLFPDGRGSTLFRIGDPVDVQWWAEGRTATRAEVLHSIETGVPLLREQAHRDGREALRELDRMVEEAMRLVPQEAGHAAD